MLSPGIKCVTETENSWETKPQSFAISQGASCIAHNQQYHIWQANTTEGIQPHRLDKQFVIYNVEGKHILDLRSVFT